MCFALSALLLHRNPFSLFPLFASPAITALTVWAAARTVRRRRKSERARAQREENEGVAAALASQPHRYDPREYVTWFDREVSERVSRARLRMNELGSTFQMDEGVSAAYLATQERLSSCREAINRHHELETGLRDRLTDEPDDFDPAAYVTWFGGAVIPLLARAADSPLPLGKR